MDGKTRTFPSSTGKELHRTNKQTNKKQAQTSEAHNIPRLEMQLKC